MRGLVLVGAADATMIGAGLGILGVPLVIPLMLLTFLAAFVPLIGAFSAGLAAVLIALVDGGVVTALIVLGLVIAVQQVEGHLLYPLIMGRTIHIHPIAVILALAIGGIIAGIIGVFISVPILTVAATALAYVRETREPAPAPLAAQPGGRSRGRVWRADRWSMTPRPPAAPRGMDAGTAVDVDVACPSLVGVSERSVVTASSLSASRTSGASAVEERDLHRQVGGREGARQRQDEPAPGRPLDEAAARRRRGPLTCTSATSGSWPARTGRSARRRCAAAG